MNLWNNEWCIKAIAKNKTKMIAKLTLVLSSGHLAPERIFFFPKMLVIYNFTMLIFALFGIFSPPCNTCGVPNQNGLYIYCAISLPTIGFNLSVSCFLAIAQVLYFFLEWFDLSPYWSELIHLSFWVKIAKKKKIIRHFSYKNCINSDSNSKPVLIARKQVNRKISNIIQILVQKNPIIGNDIAQWIDNNFLWIFSTAHNSQIKAIDKI